MQKLELLQNIFAFLKFICLIRVQWTGDQAFQSINFLAYDTSSVTHYASHNRHVKMSLGLELVLKGFYFSFSQYFFSPFVVLHKLHRYFVEVIQKASLFKQQISINSMPLPMANTINGV